jgi:hypothetical protein
MKDNVDMNLDEKENMFHDHLATSDLILGIKEGRYF